MKFRKTYILFVIALLAGVFSCNHESIEPLKVPSRKFRDITFREIPSATNNLRVNLGMAPSGSSNESNSGESSLDFDLDWENITEYTDSLGNVSYTFPLIEKEPKLFEFRNIVLRKYGEGSYSYPYLFTYKMSESFQKKYLETFSIQGFEGTVTKQIISYDLSRVTGSVANLEERMSEPGVSNCPNTTTNVSSGPSNNMPELPPTNGPGQTNVEVCQTYWVDFNDSESCGYGCVTASRSILVTECYTVSLATAGSASCDQGETAVDRELTIEELKKLIAQEIDPLKKALLQLKYLETHGEPDQIILAKLYAELYMTLLLDENPRIDQDYEFLWKSIDALYTNVVTNMLTAVFNPENVASIMAIAMYTRDLSTVTRSKMFNTIARYAYQLAGKGYKTFDAFKKAYGTAGQNMEWHHIVSQRASNLAKFGNQSIHNTKNLVRIEGGFSGSWHTRITSYYNSIPKDGSTNGLRFGEWVAQKSFQEQMEWGIKIMNLFK